MRATEFRDSAGIQIAHTRLEGDSATCELSTETVRIGAETGDSASQLHVVRDAARLSDGRLAVLNAGTHQVKIFSPDGKLAKQFGRRGDGPGEFKNLWSLTVGEGDTLIIGEYRPWRFSCFTDGGDFVRSVEARPAIIERPEVAMVLAAGRGFLIGEACCNPDERGFTDQMVTIRFYDSDGAVADTLGDFWLERSGFLSHELRYVGGTIFGARAAFAYYPGDTIVYASGRDEQVELWTADGNLGRIIRWSGRDRRVRPEDIQEWKRKHRENSSLDLASPRAREFLEAEAGDHRPVADRFPSLANWHGLLVSRDGMVWIKEYGRPFDDGRVRWFVFRPNGELACQIRVAENFDIVEVGEDYILATETDELDVENVVERRLSEPPLPSR